MNNNNITSNKRITIDNYEELYGSKTAHEFEETFELTIKELTDESFVESFVKSLLDDAFGKKKYELFTDILIMSLGKLNKESVQKYITDIHRESFDNFGRLVNDYADGINKLSQSWRAISTYERRIVESFFFENENLRDEQTLIWLLLESDIDETKIGTELMVEIVSKSAINNFKCFNILFEKFYKHFTLTFIKSLVRHMCATKNIDDFRFLLSHPYVRDNFSKISECSRNNNFLHAVCVEDAEVIKIVLDSGLIDEHMANAINDDGKTPLQLCADKQTLDTVQMLLDTGLINATSYVGADNSLISSWIFTKPFLTAQTIFLFGLKSKILDGVLNLKGIYDYTILHKLVIETEYTELISDVLSTTILTDETIGSLNASGMTFMHYVCQAGYDNWEMVMINVLCSDRISPVFVADFIASFSKDTIGLYNKEALMNISEILSCYPKNDYHRYNCDSENKCDDDDDDDDCNDWNDCDNNDCDDCNCDDEDDYGDGDFETKTGEIDNKKCNIMQYVMNKCSSENATVFYDYIRDTSNSVENVSVSVSVSKTEFETEPKREPEPEPETKVDKQSIENIIKTLKEQCDICYQQIDANKKLITEYESEIQTLERAVVKYGNTLDVIEEFHHPNPK